MATKASGTEDKKKGSMSKLSFETEWPVGMKWAQHQNQVLLSINVQAMKYYRV